MEITLNMINENLPQYQKPVLSFSGGSDSMVLLDLIYNRTEFRPPVIFTDSQMEYLETQPFIEKVCRQYGAELHIAKAERTPLQQWQKQGWPMLGKLAARHWMQKHRRYDFGIRLDVSSCCRNIKIAPARKLTKAISGDLQITGQRGQQDDALRGLRAIKDGSISYVKADKLTIFNPLIGWTDLMIRRYTKQNKLPVHPRKSEGAITIGCIYCGGGAQYTNSGFRILRKLAPELWRKFVVDYAGGQIILAVKYDKPLETIQNVVRDLGGLETLFDTRPWIFDYLAMPPKPGYDK